MRRKKKGLYRRTDKDEMNDLKDHLQGSLIVSLKNIRYLCEECCENQSNFLAETRKEMIQHHIDKHELPMELIELTPTKPYDPEYIILSHLIDIMENKKGRSKYFTISNMELWLNLCEKLDINPSRKGAPPKQMPHHILKRLGLLQRGLRERNRVGYNTKGNRAYYININDVDEALSKTNYGDLLIKLGMLDTTTLDFVKPTSATSDKNKKGDKSTGDTGELFEWKDEDCDTTPEPLPNVGIDFDKIKDNIKKTKKSKTIDEYDDDELVI